MELERNILNIGLWDGADAKMIIRDDFTVLGSIQILVRRKMPIKQWVDVVM